MKRREFIALLGSAAAWPQKPARTLMTPIAVSLAAVVVTTLILFMIDSYLGTEHLVLLYLLPTIFIAIYFGSTIAVVTSLASGLAAAYVLFPPRFSFYIADRLHIAELGFTILLAVIASKAVSVLTYDVRQRPRLRPNQLSGQSGHGAPTAPADTGRD